MRKLAILSLFLAAFSSALWTQLEYAENMRPTFAMIELGYYPGVTGHAVIANEVLELLNRTYSRSFPLVKIDEILSANPVASASAAQARRGETTEYSFKDFPDFRPKNRQGPSPDTSYEDRFE
ncbi:MAG: hypothetical protein HYX74_03255 [Acidobacteria bacterium]|nr:hypothetical protein [Acidobacteriota bacterium]